MCDIFDKLKYLYCSRFEHASATDNTLHGEYI